MPLYLCLVLDAGGPGAFICGLCSGIGVSYPCEHSSFHSHHPLLQKCFCSLLAVLGSSSNSHASPVHLHICLSVLLLSRSVFSLSLLCSLQSFSNMQALGLNVHFLWGSVVSYFLNAWSSLRSLRFSFFSWVRESLSLFAPSSSLIWMSVSFMSVFFFNDGDLWLYCM